MRKWEIKTQTIQPKNQLGNKKKTIQRDANTAIVLFEFQHPDEIMDVVEIYSPQLIATACMDQKFRLISLKEQHIIAVYHEHTTGMKKLAYCHLYNSSIASVAHENYINIWSPEISLFKAHVGKLEGHNSTVIDAGF